mgnify:CR=1 FL=1
MSSYVIYTSSGTVLTTIPPGKINTGTTSLFLVGKDTLNYGRYFNQNLVNMLTNFSNAPTVPPANPLTGQLWFDSSFNKLRVYTSNSNFELVNQAKFSPTPPIGQEPGEFWFDLERRNLNFLDEQGQYQAITSFPRDVVVGWVQPHTPVYDNDTTATNRKYVTLLESYGEVTGVLSTSAFIADSGSSVTLFEKAETDAFKIINGITLIGGIRASFAEFETLTVTGGVVSTSSALTIQGYGSNLGAAGTINVTTGLTATVASGVVTLSLDAGTLMSTTAVNLNGGLAGQFAYQSAPNTTAFASTGSMYVYRATLADSVINFNTGTLIASAVTATSAATAYSLANTGTTYVYRATLADTATTATSAATAYSLADTGTTYVYRATLADTATTATSAATAYSLANTGTTYVYRATLADTATTATSAATAYSLANTGTTYVGRAVLADTATSFSGGSVNATTGQFSGITTVTNNTGVFSTASGALQVVNGGLGVGGGGYFGGVVTATSFSSSGTVSLSGGTANGILYLNSSTVVTSGSALTWNGTTFTATNIACYGNVILKGHTARCVLYTDNGSYLTANTALQYWNGALLLNDIAGHNTTGYVRLAGGDGPANGAYVQLYGPDHATYPGRLYLNASIAGGYIDFGIASVVKMKLDSSGNLGIGTTSPNSFLHIKGGNNNVCNIDNDGSQYTNISISNNGTEKGSVYWDNTNGQFTLGSNATNSQVLFRANNAERARIDSSGNLGLGVTPSAWGSPFKPIQIGNSFSFIAGRSDAITAQVHVGANAYYNGTNWLYGITGLNATRYYQNGGQHIWENAPSGTAGNAITFTQAMTLDASGNLGIGTTSPAARLELTAAQPYIVQSWNQARANGSDYVAGGTDSYFITRDGVQNLGAYVRILDVNTFGAFPTTVRGGVVAFGTVDGINGTGSSAVERARITSGGDVLYNKILYSTNGTSAGGLALYRDHATGSCYLFDTTTAPYSGPLIFGTNNTERARIDGSGKLGIGTTSPAQMLDVRYAGSGSGAAIRFGSASYGMGQLEEESSINAVIFKNTYSTSGIFLWKADTAERARINSSGNLYVGTTSSSVDGRIVSDGADLYYSGNFTQPSSGSYCVAVHNRGTTGDNSFITFFTEAGGTQRGTITYNRGGGLTAYNTTSDYRAKKIIGPVTNPGATIDALKVYTGKMHGATVERPMLIAHEAQAVTPYAVTGEKDDVNEDGTPKFQQIDVSSLVPLLIAEIQSLRTRVAQLEKGE